MRGRERRAGRASGDPGSPPSPKCLQTACHYRRAMRTLTLRELNRATLARQLLLRRHRLSVTKALERTAGLQAQWPPSPYLGLWSRVDGFHPDDLVRAVARRRVVKATLMRTTLHLVSAADYLAYGGIYRASRIRGAPAAARGPRGGRRPGGGGRAPRGSRRRATADATGAPRAARTTQAPHRGAQSVARVVRALGARRSGERTGVLGLALQHGRRHLRPGSDVARRRRSDGRRRGGPSRAPLSRGVRAGRRGRTSRSGRAWPGASSTRGWRASGCDGSATSSTATSSISRARRSLRPTRPRHRVSSRAGTTCCSPTTSARAPSPTSTAGRSSSATATCQRRSWSTDSSRASGGSKRGRVRLAPFAPLPRTARREVEDEARRLEGFLRSAGKA